jgi:hypothetical protein
VTGDTLAARLDSLDIVQLRVIGASSASSLLTWIGTPAELAVGDKLVLTVRVWEVEAEEAEANQPARVSLLASPDRRTTRARPARSVDFRGSVLVSLAAVRSTTRPESEFLESHTNTFATPSIALRSVLSGLPGGTSFSFHARASHRHSSGGILDQPNSLRLYQFSLSKEESGRPVAIQVGRFSNRNEPESGYWDGVLLETRLRHVEFGLAAGLEPDRFDEGFRSDLPKYSAHVLIKPDLGRASWATNLSFTQMRPSNAWLTHSYFGFDQRIRYGVLLLAADAQLDRNPEMDHWILSRFRSRASFSLFHGGTVHVRHSIRRPYAYWRADDVLSYRRDQSSAGFNYGGERGHIGAYVTRNTFDEVDEAFTYSLNASLKDIPLLHLDLGSSASYWTRRTSETRYATFTIGRQISAARVQLLYSLYRADVSQIRSETQTVGGSIQLPLWSGTQVSLQGRTLFGRELVSTSMSFSFWMSF